MSAATIESGVLIDDIQLTASNSLGVTKPFLTLPAGQAR